MPVQHPPAEELNYTTKVPMTRQYVSVRVNFDRMGFMYPTSIIWNDKKEYPIDVVLDSRPMEGKPGATRQDRYKIKVKGQNKILYFEHKIKNDTSAVGAWYVLIPTPKYSY